MYFASTYGFQKELPYKSSSVPSPSEEQKAIIDMAISGNNLKVQAFAGTGKTTTIKQLAHKLKKTSIYIAFNKAIVEEVKRSLPYHVKAYTAHSMAYQAIVAKNEQYKMKFIERESLWLNSTISQYLSCQLDENLLSVVRRITLNFLSSPDKELCYKHITKEDQQLLNKIGNRPNSNIHACDLKKNTVLEAKYFWQSIIDECSTCPIDHSVYFKLWQLSNPRLDAQIIYIDEAQDLDPVMLDVIQNQHAQKIWLGDKYQQIYAWRGALNALDQIVDAVPLSLTATYRFPTQLTQFPNKILKKLNEDKEIVSKSSPNPKAAIDKVIIARSNLTLLMTALHLAEQQQYFYLDKASFNRKKILAHCSSVIALNCSRNPNIAFYQDFISLMELEQYLEDVNDDFLAKPLSLCKKFNFNFNRIRGLFDIVENYNREGSPLILITAHKSKGKEWDHVELCDDFAQYLKPDISGNIENAELNLLYVATTRSKQFTFIPEIVSSAIDSINLKQMYTREQVESTFPRDHIPSFLPRVELD